MTPTQFSRRSGIIIDICRAHGVWFDRDELRRIVDFIRAGGLARARDLDKEDLQRAKRDLDARTREFAGQEHLTSIASTGSILGTLLRD
jgi:Zn-finger nucleic acid-binding protein